MVGAIARFSRCALDHFFLLLLLRGLQQQILARYASVQNRHRQWSISQEKTGKQKGTKSQKRQSQSSRLVVGQSTTLEGKVKKEQEEHGASLDQVIPHDY